MSSNFKEFWSLVVEETSFVLSVAIRDAGVAPLHAVALPLKKLADWRLRSLRVSCLLSWAMMLLAGLAAEAAACASPNSMRTIFYRTVPFDANAPIIAEIVIIAVTQASAPAASIPEHERRLSYEGEAHVKRVIRGSIDVPVIRIAIAHRTSCDVQFRAGDAGIVAGSIQRDRWGQIKLYALSETPIRN